MTPCLRDVEWVRQNISQDIIDNWFPKARQNAVSHDSDSGSDQQMRQSQIVTDASRNEVSTNKHGSTISSPEPEHSIPQLGESQQLSVRSKPPGMEIIGRLEPHLQDDVSKGQGCQSDALLTRGQPSYARSHGIGLGHVS